MKVTQIYKFSSDLESLCIVGLVQDQLEKTSKFVFFFLSTAKHSKLPELHISAQGWKLF